MEWYEKLRVCYKIFYFREGPNNERVGFEIWSHGKREFQEEY